MKKQRQFFSDAYLWRDLQPVAAHSLLPETKQKQRHLPKKRCILIQRKIWIKLLNFRMLFPVRDRCMKKGGRLIV